MLNHSMVPGDSASVASASGFSVPALRDMARRLRRHVITMTAAAGSGHPGGSLSAADIVAALYFKVMRHDPENPQWEDRDRFILSKGHSAPVLYAALAESGYFPTEHLSTLRKLGSRLQGHTDRNLTPGVEMTAGSLGMGLSFGIGVALAAPTIASLRVIMRYIYAKLFDLDPFPMVGAPSLPRAEREAELERRATVSAAVAPADHIRNPTSITEHSEG